MSEQKNSLDSRRENLDKRRKRLDALRSKGAVGADKISIYDEAEISRVETQSREEGGKAEIPMTAQEGMEVLQHMNDGDVTRADIAEFHEFMSGMSGRISQLETSMTRLNAANNPQIAAKRAEMQYKLTMLRQIRGAVKTGAASKTVAPTEKKPPQQQLEENQKKNPPAMESFSAGFKATPYSYDSCLAILKILREGRDAGRAMRAIGLNENGQPLVGNETRFNKLVMDGLKQKQSSSDYLADSKPKRRRSLAELSGRKKPRKPVLSTKRTGFNASKAQQLMLAARQNQGNC